MRKLLALVVLAGVAAADDKQDVAKAAAKTAQLTNYAFTITANVEGGFFVDLEFEGGYDGKIGSLTKGQLPGGFGELMVARSAKAIVFKREGGEWNTADDAAGQLGEAGAFLVNYFAKSKLPHEEVAACDKHFKDIKKVQDDKVVRYTGELNKDGVAYYNPINTIKDDERIKGLEASGSATLWMDDSGTLSKWEIKINAKVEVDGTEYEVTITRTVTLSDVGNAKVELPKEALEKMNQ